MKTFFKSSQILHFSALFIACILIGSLISPSLAYANNNLSDTDNSGFLEINSGIIAFKSRYTDAPNEVGSITDLRLAFNWQGFFIENRGFKGLGLPGIGYNFYNQDAWMLDLFITETHPGILWDYDGSITDKGIINEQEGLIGITPREPDGRVSIRATHFIDDTTALRIVLAPSSDINQIDNNSPYLAAWYGKTWLYKNINLHATLNAQYYNAHILDYYYGVRAQEQSDKFETYTASSGISVSAEFGMAYPLAPNWLLESSFKITRLPDSIANSPLVERRVEPQTQISLTYVIF